MYCTKIIKTFLRKNETVEMKNTKIKLLTGGKGLYPYSLCDDAAVMKK